MVTNLDDYAFDNLYLSAIYTFGPETWTDCI